MPPHPDRETVITKPTNSATNLFIALTPSACALRAQHCTPRLLSICQGCERDKPQMGA